MPCGISAYYLPMRDWRALRDILLAVLDPRLAPLLAGGPGRGLGLGNETQPDSGPRDRWIGSLSPPLPCSTSSSYWVCIPYRTQQRFMLQSLGLAAVPLARLLDRWRGLRIFAAVLLALHLLTPQTWPIDSR